MYDIFLNKSFIFLDANTKRQSGKKVQVSNIEAAKVRYIIIRLHLFHVTLLLEMQTIFK